MCNPRTVRARGGGAGEPISAGVIAAEQVDADDAATDVVHPIGVLQAPAGRFDLGQDIGARPAL